MPKQINDSTVDLADGKFLTFKTDDNTVTVTGTDSELSVQYSTSAAGIQVNSSTSNNKLEALDGAFIVTGRFILGSNSSTVFDIDGTGSEFQTRNAVSMSSGATLNVTIGNGGLWDAKNFTDTDGTMTVNINDGGTLSARDNIDVSNIDNFNFNSGGTLLVKSTKVLSGLSSVESLRTVDLSTGSSFGTSTTLNGGTVLTAAFDMTNLTFTSGTLSASGSLTNLPTLTSGRIVDISGGGSFGDATTLNGGTVQTAAFDNTNLTFTSGTLEASGALTNQNTLASGQNVVLDGGTWSPTGNIDGGNTTIQNSGSVSVGTDFNGTNLTFTNGSLTVNGDVSNLPTISSGLTTNLSGGGSLLDSTTLDGGTLNGSDFDLNGNLTFTSGTLNVTGTLQNLTSLSTGSTVNMDGASAALLFTENFNISGGTLNIDNGAKVTVGAGSVIFAASGGNIELGGGTLNIASVTDTLVLNSNASITGYGNVFGPVNLGTSGDAGTIDGDAANNGLKIFGDVSGNGTLADTTVFGNLSIGNSPGNIELQNVTLGGSTVVNMGIEGTSSGQYDTLVVDGNTLVASATLTVAFSSYTPDNADTWQLITGGVNVRSFGTINLPTGWQLSSGGFFSAIPEPETYALFLGLGMLILAIFRKKN